MRRVIASVLLYAFSTGVYAVDSWAWEILDPVRTVQSNETVSFTGVIHNLSDVGSLSGLDQVYVHYFDSDTPLITTRALEFWTLIIEPDYDAFVASYDFSYSHDAVSSQFEGVVIGPGESYAFELAKLVPQEGGATVGSYQLGFSPFYKPSGYVGPLVTEVEISVVPLPGAAVLFLSAASLLGLGLQRKGVFCGNERGGMAC